MALGKTNRFQGKSYSLRLKLKDGDKFLDVPQFEVQENQDGKYVATGQVDTVSGDLFRIETRSFDHAQGTIRSFKAGLRDREKNEAYFVDIGLGNSVGRNIANSLLNLPAFDSVELGLYGQKREGRVYAAASVRQGGVQETVKWKYDPKEVKELQPRQFEGKLDPATKKPKIEKDWTGPELFLFDKLTEFGKKLAAESASQEAPASAGQPATETPQQENLDEDVPF